MTLMDIHYILEHFLTFLDISLHLWISVNIYVVNAFFKEVWTTEYNRMVDIDKKTEEELKALPKQRTPRPDKDNSADYNPNDDVPDDDDEDDDDIPEDEGDDDYVAETQNKKVPIIQHSIKSVIQLKPAARLPNSASPRLISTDQQIPSVSSQEKTPNTRNFSMKAIRTPMKAQSSIAKSQTDVSIIDDSARKRKRDSNNDTIMRETVTEDVNDILGISSSQKRRNNLSKLYVA